MLMPAILAVALILGVIRWKLMEPESGRSMSLTKIVPTVIVLVVAVLVIGAISTVNLPYVWDEDSGELTIQKDVSELNSQPWDSYASEVKSLTIKNGVTVASGAFDTMTNLEHVTIGADAEIASGAFGVAFQDAFGESITVSDLDGYSYAGLGNGTLYQADPAIFAYSSDGATILGLADGSAAAVHIVLPERNGTTTVRAVEASAFLDNTTIQDLLSVSECKISEIRNRAFQNCTSLESVIVPESVRTIEYTSFRGCTSLASVQLPAGLTAIQDYTFSECEALASINLPAALTSIGYHALYGTALTAVELPSGLKLLGNGSLQNCASLESLSFPASMETVQGYIFFGCTGVKEVAFEEGFAPTLGQSWNGDLVFYDSDGTTRLDAGVASNLAGHTFKGTHSALVMQN